MTANDLQTTVLEDLSQAVNYRRWLAGLVRPHLGDDPVEIGAGIGDYAAEWLPGLRRLTLTRPTTPVSSTCTNVVHPGDLRRTHRELARLGAFCFERRGRIDAGLVRCVE